MPSGRELRLTPDIGTGVVEDHERVPFTELRATRRGRVFDLLERLDLDVLVVGREANARYLSGARRLWTASSRPFVPSCVAVRATGRVHVMSFSASYEGTPDEIDLDEVFCNSFNPGLTLARLAAIPGLGEARRVGVDSFSFLFADLLPNVMPTAEFIGVEPELLAVRRHKLPAEVDAIRTAAAIAESSLLAAAELVRPGVSEKELQAAYLARMCELGTSQFALQGTFTTIEPGGGLRWITSDRAIGASSTVALAGGVLWAGYEGSLARSWWSGPGAPSDAARDAHRRWRRVIDAMSAECRPGRTGADLVAAHRSAGEALPPMTIAHAVGLGHEGPLAGSSLGERFDAAQHLEASMVVALRTFVPTDAGGYLGEELVLVTEEGPEPITTLGHGPLGA